MLNTCAWLICAWLLLPLFRPKNQPPYHPHVLSVVPPSVHVWSDGFKRVLIVDEFTVLMDLRMRVLHVHMWVNVCICWYVCMYVIWVLRCICVHVLGPRSTYRCRWAYMGIGTGRCTYGYRYMDRYLYTHLDEYMLHTQICGSRLEEDVEALNGSNMWLWGKWVYSLF